MRTVIDDGMTKEQARIAIKIRNRVVSDIWQGIVHRDITASDVQKFMKNYAAGSREENIRFRSVYGEDANNV